MNALAKALFYYGLANSDDYKIVCPFHEDVNASLSIDYVTGTYFCFGCAKTGNCVLNDGLDEMIEKAKDWMEEEI